MFTVSLAVSVAVSAWGMAYPDRLADGITRMTAFCLHAFEWGFLLSITGFMALCFVLALGRVGDTKLGRDDDEPEFGLVSWVSMLFAAGMGAGLLFWGVAGPLHHYVSPPPGFEPRTAEAARWSMVVTNLHWGLHAWGIYALSGLILGYYGFRRGYPLLASSPIRAVFGGRGGAAWGRVADVVAVLAVVFGVAGSLGMGVTQIRSGMAEVLGTPADSTAVTAGILAAVVAAYLVSASTGLGQGIKLLSNLNVLVAALLLLFLLFTGPTTFLLSTFVTSLGDYVTNVVPLSFQLYPYSGETEWNRLWTLTYFIWYVAWAPFVGIFIARISRGRTVRQFVLTVMFVPTLFSILWFAVLGGTGLHLELFGREGLGSLVVEDPSQGLFGLLRVFPLAEVLLVTSLGLVFIFLVTSADSGSFVLGMMTSEGSLDPRTSRKLLWGVLVGLLCAAALYTGGGVHVMRAVAISGAIPFAVIMVTQAGCLLWSLFTESAEEVERS